MEMQSSIQKVWKTGSTLVISIPKNLREIMKYQKGDRIKVYFGEIVKREENNEIIINEEESRNDTSPEEINDLVKEGVLPEL